MGDGHPAPPESDIRTEARYIIEAAAKHREERRFRGPRLPPWCEETAGDDGDTTDSSFNKGPMYPTPITANGHSQPELSYPAAGPSSYSTDRSGNSFDIPPYPPHESYEEQFAAIQRSYRKLAAVNGGFLELARTYADDLRPSTFHEEQDLTVVLAPPASKIKARDKIEKSHEEGFDGLTPELEADAVGFVENVRVRILLKRCCDLLTNGIGQYEKHY